MACIAYVCAGIFRLARFNVTAAHQSRFFLGVPTTLAACAVAGTLFLDDAPPAVLPARSAVMLLFAYLMVSRWRFPTYKDVSPPLIVVALASVTACVTFLGPAAGGLLLVGAYFFINTVEFVVRLVRGGAVEQ